jgi:hypothetical protein
VLSNGPSPKLPRSRGAARFIASAVNTGVRPSSGSITSDVCRYDLFFHEPSLWNAPLVFSDDCTRSSSAFWAAANSSSFMKARVPNFSGRSRGMPSAASLVQTPEMSGSPHSVFGCTNPFVGVASCAAMARVASLGACARAGATVSARTMVPADGAT